MSALDSPAAAIRSHVPVTMYQPVHQRGNEEDTTEDGRRNNILQKAILLYIGEVSSWRVPSVPPIVWCDCRALCPPLALVCSCLEALRSRGALRALSDL